MHHGGRKEEEERNRGKGRGGERGAVDTSGGVAVVWKPSSSDVGLALFVQIATVDVYAWLGFINHQKTHARDWNRVLASLMPYYCALLDAL